ncbi:Uncharacterised protein [Neisseria meningitidis]|nr:Uncharacterised protein [Neisseria meningitidis]
MFNQHRGGFARLFQEVQVFFELGETQHRHAALARAEKFAGAADVEVLAGDFKAVGVFVDDFQPRFGEFAQGFGKQEDAHAFCRAAPDPTA